MEFLKNKLISFLNDDIFPIKVKKYKKGIIYKLEYADNNTLFSFLENQIPGILINDDEDGNYDKPFYSAERINGKITIYEAEIWDKYEIYISQYKEIVNSNDFYRDLFTLTKSASKDVFEYLSIDSPHDYLINNLIQNDIFPIIIEPSFEEDGYQFSDVFAIKKDTNSEKWYIITFVHPQPDFNFPLNYFWEYEVMEGSFGKETESWSTYLNSNFIKKITKYLDENQLHTEEEIINLIKLKDKSEFMPLRQIFDISPGRDIELLKRIQTILQ